MDYADQPTDCCSIARTVSITGDRWMMLILRDLSNGLRRFDELIAHLGIARDVLTRRLVTLVAEGMVERRPYQEAGRRPRDEYRLTVKGRDFLPVLIALMHWGDAHLAGPSGPPVRLRHADCGAELQLQLRCAAGHELTPGRAVEREFNPAALDD
ncbi:MAG TPA: helix-turn-helix domain-containing protein [Pseudonocardiaceae bacterium]|jgi:DNA-binding HxlR family transcriptional regulator|nr:helix-turn-helix domain-containing protein [Pseudonocardiaceae bacterium]